MVPNGDFLRISSELHAAHFRPAF